MNSSRLSRRRFVGGATAMGAGTAALGLVGCGDDDDGDDNGGSAAPTEPGGNGGTGTTPGTTASPASGEKQRGGILRGSSADNTWDSFDADRTRFGPMSTLLGWTNHGVVCWESYAESKIGGYFAESWETPDDTTYVFKVRQGLTWHDKPPVNGRLANAEDIVFHVNRNKDGKLQNGQEDPNFYRNSLFQNVESAEAVDETTVRIKTVRPWPFLLNLFAGAWTKVQAPEAVMEFEDRYNQFSADLIIGTGEFVLTNFTAEGDLGFRRFDKATREPWLDGVDLVPLFTDAAARQAAFEQKQVDSFTPATVTVLNDLKERYEGEVYEKSTFVANPVSGTYYGGAPPWNDPNLIGAIFRILDRRGLVQQLLEGRGAISGYVPPAWAPFAMQEAELSQFPGYLEDRDKDHTEARAMWDASDGASLGEILVDIPDIYEGANSGVASLITNHLKSVLGNEFRAKLEPYATITSKIVQQRYGNGTPNIWFGWVNPPADPDPSLSFISGLHSSTNGYKQFEVVVPGLDDLIDKMAVEFDVQNRIDLVHQAERLVLEHWGAGLLPQYLQISNILYHNYYNTGEVTNFVTAHNTWRDTWFNQNDPTWQGRPT